MTRPGCELSSLASLVFFDGMCAIATPGFSFCSVPDVADFLGVLCGHRVETDNEANQRWAELEVVLVRTCNPLFVVGLFFFLQLG